jgi:hypothetical protein
MDILRAKGLEERHGYFGLWLSVADIIDEFQCKAAIRAHPDLPPP